MKSDWNKAVRDWNTPNTALTWRTHVSYCSILCSALESAALRFESTTNLHVYEMMLLKGNFVYFHFSSSLRNPELPFLKLTTKLCLEHNSLLLNPVDVLSCIILLLSCCCEGWERSKLRLYFSMLCELHARQSLDVEVLIMHLEDRGRKLRGWNKDRKRSKMSEKMNKKHTCIIFYQFK